jgi:hypothetical protein
MREREMTGPGRRIEASKPRDLAEMIRQFEMWTPPLRRPPST